MKQIKRLTVLLLVGLAITAHSQNLVDSLSLINGVLQPNPMRWDDLPVHELILTSESLAKPLPSAVSNDTSRFFPPIFHQTGNSCVHAAEIGYNLTYEMNRLRGVNAGTWDNHDPNLFPHLYSFNFVNEGSNVMGTPVYSGFQIVLSNGCPMYDDWCYTDGQNNSMQYWMDGYEKYHRGMNNRVIGVKTITLDNYNANTCVNHLKHWLADHGAGSDVGGVAVICVYTDGWVYNSILPEQSAHSGEKVISQMGNSAGYNPPSHAMTIVGYDDNICYDINGDGQITTNIDINGDERIDIYDSEYGALKIANSWGISWFGNNGFIWLPYSLLDEIMKIGHDRRVYVCEVEERDVQLAYKATIKHSHRGHLALHVGYSANTTSSLPQFENSYNVFNNQGGEDTPMHGIDTNPIEIGLDFSSKYPNLTSYKKYFLQAVDNNTGTGNYSEGECFIRDFTLVDYRWGETFELPCPTTNKPIGKNTTTTLSINYDLLPFDGSPLPLVYANDMVVRRTVYVSSNTQIDDDVNMDLYGTESYDCTLFIKPGTTLTIGDGVTFKAKRGTCKIAVRGSLVLGENVNFIAEDGATLEVDLSQAESISGFDKTTFESCSLSLPNKSLSFYGCSFTDTPLVMNNGSYQPNLTVAVDSCKFDVSSNEFDYAIYLEHYDAYTITKCTVNGGTSFGFLYGIYLKNCGNPIVEQNRIVSNNTISNCVYGGLMYYTTNGDIVCNKITGCKRGVSVLNHSNVGLFSGNCGALDPQYTQYIHDNLNCEVYISESSLPSQFKYNYICGTGSHPYFKYDGNTLGNNIEIDISDNYWGIGLNPNEHFDVPSNATLVYTPFWSVGSCPTIIVRSDQALLAAADSLVQTGQFNEAKNVYKQVVVLYPSTVSAQTALKSLYEIEFNTGNNFTQLKQYFLNESAIAVDTHLASSLANKCDEILGNYDDAIGWYENVILDPLSSFNDSIFATIDLGDLYLRMGNEGTKGTMGKLSQFIPISRKAHEKQTLYALSLLSNKSNIKDGDYPTDYWTDVVTEQPEGYEMDEQGNVTISSAEGLAWFAAVVNGRNGQEANDFEGKTVKLVSDIDMGLHLWEAIGNSYYDDSVSYDYVQRYFKGSFVGGKHEISNLVYGERGYYRRLGQFSGYDKCQGLFGNLLDAEVKGLKLNNFICLNQDDMMMHFGSIASFSEQSVIDRCVSKGSIYEYYNGQYENNSEIYAGGLVYNNLNSAISNCVFVADSCVSFQMGGIAHDNNTTMEGHRAEISNCYFYGEMYDYPWYKKERMDNSAGIVQYNSTDPDIVQGSIIRNCYYYPIEPKFDLAGYRAAIAWWHRGNSVIENCYYLAVHDIPFYTGVVSRPDEWATVDNTSAFYCFNGGCILEDPVEIGGEMVDDLKEALNRWVAIQQSSSDYENWCDDVWMEQGGAPLLCTVYEATEEKAERPSIVAPNPVVNNLSIISDEVISVAVYDATGKMMVRTTDKHIDMTMYKPGIYIVSITFDDGKCQSEKVIKK